MPEAFSHTTAFRPSPNLLMRKVDDEFVLFDIGAAEQLTREFHDVGLETVERETKGALNMSEREGLLETDVP